MKRKLSPIYYIIPVVYIGVILFFIFMQFQAREKFSERIGSLVVSGVFAKTLGGEQRMRHLEVQFHGLRMEFSASANVIAGFGETRESKLALESFNQFPDGFELALNDDAALRFVVEGGVEDRVVITPSIPRQLRGMRTLSLPFHSLDGTVEAVKGIPLLAHQGPAGLTYASLSSGSQIDTEEGRFVLRVGSEGDALVLERVPEDSDPYVYWFSRSFTLVDEENFADTVESYLNRAYQYWYSVFLGNPGSRDLIGDLGTSLISEAIKRGEYRRTLALLSRNLRQLASENADNPELYNSAAYLGNLPSFLAARQNSASEQIQGITDLIRQADFSVFKTPRLLPFILNHAPFSLAEEVLRLADSVQLETADVNTLINLVIIYLDALKYLDVGEATLARMSDIIDRFVFPSIHKTQRGLFLSTSRSDQAPEANLYMSILMGTTLMQAGEALARQSYTAIGRTLTYSALDLADTEGFLPARVLIQSGEAEPRGDLLSPQSVYHLLPGSYYTPTEYPLYSFLYPGSWIWTVSRLADVKIDDTQYRFFFSFTVGDTHYLLIQGIRPVSSVIMHGIPWKSDPEYFRYSDGWLYDETTQTLYAKMTHRTESEELVLNY
ncbi:MAG: hypothetical protein JSV89_03425 [Spirochaetaceae bacterium]|nr:MAG: hypothetical protein JSV89_03425 [Spirochaetaceae bacterium]